MSRIACRLYYLSLLSMGMAPAAYAAPPQFQVVTTARAGAVDGTPTALGNSVIERIVGNGTVAASSCISCHAYASFNASGAPSDAAKAILPFNPTGKPIPAVLQKSRKFDFSWGLITQ